jgi:hypothetical protein
MDRFRLDFLPIMIFGQARVCYLTLSVVERLSDVADGTLSGRPVQMFISSFLYLLASET